VLLPAAMVVIEPGLMAREERYMEQKFRNPFRAYRPWVRPVAARSAHYKEIHRDLPLAQPGDRAGAGAADLETGRSEPCDPRDQGPRPRLAGTVSRDRGYRPA